VCGGERAGRWPHPWTPRRGSRSAGQVRVLLPRPDRAEEGEEVCRRRRRGRERRRGGRGTGVDREVRGEAGEPGAHEEDRHRLERPADVVAVAVGHADERPGLRRRAQPPRPREQPPVPVPAPVGRGEVGRLSLHAVRRVVLRLRGRVLAPEVDGRRRRVPLRLLLSRRHGEAEGRRISTTVGRRVGGVRCCQLRSGRAAGRGGGSTFGCGTGRGVGGSCWESPQETRLLKCLLISS
jgi:hypothetical protein